MRQTKNSVIVIFGASGDLTKRKLIPALFQLAKDGLLPKNTSVVGFARKEKTHDGFRAEMEEALISLARAKPKRGDKDVGDFLSRLYYQTGNYQDIESFQQLEKTIASIYKEDKVKPDKISRLYYLATPPSVFPEVITMLGKTGHLKNSDSEDRWSRVVIEKPFGKDLESARTLNSDILSILNENQVYRIDHYLGKETVQNIMAFRFGNSIFEPLWNRRYVDHIQITVSEDVSVEGRGGYYDNSGALRDMVQNHILQLVALVAMEPPASFAPNAVRDEKVKVLSALRPIERRGVKHATVRGQYVAGNIDGRTVPDYLSEPGVDPESQTETFAAVKVFIDNWRWADVPFYVRTGKAMKKRLSEITIEFRQPPLALFKRARNYEPGALEQMGANSLALRVQPNEGIRLHFGLKIPGPSIVLQPTEMEFCYSDVFHSDPPEAYERLILDTIAGDNTLFIRHDEVEAAWRFVDSISKGWAEHDSPHIYPYRAGGWGPHASDEFMQKDGRQWQNN